LLIGRGLLGIVRVQLRCYADYRDHLAKPTPSHKEKTFARRMKQSFMREFTRKTIRTIGLETGLEDVRILFDKRKQNTWRRLDNKHQNQLATIYSEHLPGLIAEDDLLGCSELVITKIEVPPVLYEMKVYWRAFGDQRDEEMSIRLESRASLLRKKLSEILYGTSIPSLKFIPDRSHLIMAETDHLFNVADYGVQYRALSHTGAIMGSTSDIGTETQEEKAAKLAHESKYVPPWLIAKKKRTEEPRLVAKSNVQEDDAGS